MTQRFTNMTNLAIRRVPKDTNEIEVNNGERIKIYLKADNIPTSKGIKYITWKFDFLNKTDELNFHNVCLDIPNYYCGEDIVVHLECSNILDPANQKISIFEKIWSYFPSIFPEEEEVKFTATRTFRASCKPFIHKDAKFCYKGHGERIKQKDGYYYMRTIERGYVNITVEGLNGKELSVKVKTNNGSYEEKVVVKRNMLSVPVLLEYNKFIETQTDLLIIEVVKTRGIPRATFQFDLKIDQKRAWEIDEVRAMLEIAVVGGQLKLAENNYHPCKYTEISAKTITTDEELIPFLFDEILRELGEELDIRLLKGISHRENEENKVIIFDEGIGSEKELNYPIIGSLKERTAVITIKDHNVRKCTNNPKHESFVFINNEKYRIDNVTNEVKINYTYPYSKESHVPFDCFWPTWQNKGFSFDVNTCRHSRNINIGIYPDVQWSLGLVLKITKNKTTKKLDPFFGLAASVSWDDKKNKGSASIRFPINKQKVLDMAGSAAANEIRKELEQKLNEIYGDGTALIMKAFMNFCVFIGDMMDAQDLAPDLYRRKPVVGSNRQIAKIEPIFPDLSCAFEWKAVTHRAKVGTAISGKISGTIIGIKATFDIFALVSKNPTMKVAVEVLDFVAKYLFRAEVKFEIVIKGEIKPDGSVTYNTASKDLNGSLKVTGTISLTVVLEFSIDSGTNETVMTDSYGADGSAGVYAEIDFLFYNQDEIKEAKKDGLYGELDLGMKQLKVGIYKKESVKIKGNEKETLSSSESKKYTQQWVLLNERSFLPKDKNGKTEKIIFHIC